MGILNLFAAGGGGANTVLTINGTAYDLASGPATISGYGRYTVTTTATISFRLQLWGAGGGQASYGAAGGYAQGVISLATGQNYLLLIGQGGSSSTGTASFPDGGPVPGYATSNNGWPGGGSSRFGPFYSAGNENISSNTYYLIAGGGGGGHMYGSRGGAGGGSTGEAGSASEYGAGSGAGGTQSAGGTGGAASSYGGTGGDGSKYQGGTGVAYSVYGGGGAGGGGYYGGGAGGTVYAAGGGGAGYIDTGNVTSGVLTTGSWQTPPNPLSNKPANIAGPTQGGAAIFTLVV